jgi:hypothetical protein
LQWQAFESRLQSISQLSLPSQCETDFTFIPIFSAHLKVKSVLNSQEPLDLTRLSAGRFGSRNAITGADLVESGEIS